MLVEDRYGKERVRLVRVTRRAGRHDLVELTVGIRFEGDFRAAHEQGDNRNVLPTDTMKNAVYALAHAAAPGPVEAFGARLARHFLDGNPRVARVRVELAEHPWARIEVAGRPHRHSFVRAGADLRTADVTATRAGVELGSGLRDLLVLKTTGSAFAGFRKDRLTTLPETADRILSTSIDARWTWRDGVAAAEAGRSWSGVRRTLLEAFARHDESRSVQHTLHAMGEAVLARFSAVAAIRLTLPNRHCLLVNLAPFGLENRNEVFVPTDEPHGLIEATLAREERVRPRGRARPGGRGGSARTSASAAPRRSGRSGAPRPR